MRIGFGYDVHQLVENRPLVIGGVTLAYHLGLEGHSDADVLLHAICDALLGAAALGDIGFHFPNTDPAFKDISSLKLLHHVGKLLHQEGYKIGNIDAMVIMEAPKLRPHIDLMRQNIATELALTVNQVSIKATTNETIGFVGREEGVAAQAVCLIVEN